jgi:hypothetical protein
VCAGDEQFGAVSSFRAFNAVSCELVCPSAMRTRLLVSPHISAIVPRSASR